MSQLILNACISAAIYAIVAAGFGLILHVARFFNFAHGLAFVVGAYIAFFFRVSLGLPLSLCIIIAVFFSALTGYSTELWIYRRLRHRQATSTIFLLVSLGVYTVGQNIISLLFGESINSIRSGSAEVGFDILGGKITPLQLFTICTSAAVLVTLGLVMRFSRMGKAMRATSDNPELALACGIRVDQVVLYSVVLGSALAGLAGVLAALDVGLTPTMGIRALMMGVVVVLIGGIGRISGIALGALFLGLAQQIGVWKISSQWQEAIAFIILLAFMMVRPQGFLGKKIRKSAV